MSEQESMFRVWSTTLILVLTGLLMASERMALVGEERKIVEVFGNDMRELMRRCDPEQRKVLVSMLAKLSSLAARVEPTSCG